MQQNYVFLRGHSIFDLWRPKSNQFIHEQFHKNGRNIMPPAPDWLRCHKAIKPFFARFTHKESKTKKRKDQNKNPRVLWFSFILKDTCEVLISFTSKQPVAETWWWMWKILFLATFGIRRAHPVADGLHFSTCGHPAGSWRSLQWSERLLQILTEHSRSCHGGETVCSSPGSPPILWMEEWVQGEKERMLSVWGKWREREREGFQTG